ncbi:Spy0128 family protein [Atopobium sp. oral taxon 416]|uniref:DUF7601 domain-containing protein n=1 Tax=Atopobium sp. oral taxon 416 TaxID=712157 RepID=UPI001BA52378|nr:FctA domain-containing protein [Atopobium sp. oral taxon 416]QUC04375.1 hypothetical protein J4859_05440 [Atopobium sp. oral taxon 416]
MKFSSKKFGSIATAAVLAGTMAFMPATAFATTVTSTNNLVSKTWVAASNAQLNDAEKFTFDLTFDSAKTQQQGTNTLTDFSDFGTKKVDVTTTWKKDANGKTSATANLSAADLFGTTDFTTPGTYVFHLKEEKGSNPNITYSDVEYDIYVTVAWPDDYPTSKTPVIKSIKVHDKDNNKTETASFTNSAAANDNLTVSKNVSGSAANIADTFSYTLDVKGATGQYTVKKSDGTSDTLTAGTTYTFTLQDGQHIVVNNLPDGATYTVTETDTKSYDSTDVTDEDDTTADNVTLADVKGGNAPIGKGTISKGGDAVAFKNKKGFASDTGITMNTLPFIAVAMVAVAGGVALVISRRRHAGEDF